ncbi:hypothetical protein NIES4102_28430 [Chondrocystis sp. NIES-4102]|nr:hypothetical protein NIES4102_28430 [Chondrocystis sp. NIES-4102]
MSGLLKVIEIELHHIVTLLKLLIEGIAIFIIAFSIIKTIPKFLRSYRRRDAEDFYHTIRLDLGLSLSLSLEFLLAADILGTAISPSWVSIGLLAATAGIRTFLNYFLHQEIKELEAAKFHKDSDHI